MNASIHTSTHRQHTTFAAALCLACSLLSACVTEGPPAQPTLRPRPSQPSGLLPNVVDLNTGRYATDSDKNGYADSVSVTVYLFNTEGSYRSPLSAEGSFVFEMTDPQGKPLGHWDFTSAQSAAARQQLLPGPGYVFRFSLIDSGTDRIPSTNAKLRCRFTPTGGRPIESRSIVLVTVGKLG